MRFTEQQIGILKRLEEYLPALGSATECHQYYCPSNIDSLIERLGGNKRDEISFEGSEGTYHGKLDGFDSECPRFFCIDRKKKKWKCLSGLEMIAILLNLDHKELYQTLKPHFKPRVKGDSEILGFSPDTPSFS